MLQSFLTGFHRGPLCWFSADHRRVRTRCQHGVPGLLPQGECGLSEKRRCHRRDLSGRCQFQSAWRPGPCWRRDPVRCWPGRRGFACCWSWPLGPAVFGRDKRFHSPRDRVGALVNIAYEMSAARKRNFVTADKKKPRFFQSRSGIVALRKDPSEAEEMLEAPASRAGLFTVVGRPKKSDQESRLGWKICQSGASSGSRPTG